MLLIPTVSIAAVDVLASGWWNASLEELSLAREQIDNQILALGGNPDSYNKATHTPTPILSPTPFPFLSTDEHTQKYEEWALYILNEVYSESWKNPESLQIHGIDIYLFDEGFEKEYSYYRENKRQTGNKTVSSAQVFFDVDYSAQNGFGGMNRDSLAYQFRPDCYLDAKETGNIISESITCIGGDEDTWVHPLLQEIKRDWEAYTKHSLDIDYLLNKYYSEK